MSELDAGLNRQEATAWANLWSLGTTSSDGTVRFSTPDLVDAIDRIVAAEMRALLALHPGGSLNYWVSRRADKLESPAVDL